MRRRIDRPEQLHLELQCGYLDSLLDGSEEFDYFENATKLLLDSDVVDEQSVGTENLVNGNSRYWHWIVPDDKN